MKPFFSKLTTEKLTVRLQQGRFQTGLRKKRTLGIVQFENGPGRVQKPRESKTKTKRKNGKSAKKSIVCC